MATLAGEAAVRIVPSFKGFKTRVKTELAATPAVLQVRVDTDTAKRQLEMFRAKEHADAVNLKAKLDASQVYKEFSQVEHIFKRNRVAQAIRVNAVVMGADSLVALGAAAGSAATAVDALAKSALLLPAALSQALVVAGSLKAALGGIGDALDAYASDQEDAGKAARDSANAQRDAERAYRDVNRALKGVRDTYRDVTREIQDMNHEARKSSLDEADALLNLQESIDNFHKGGFKSATEFRRAQLGVAQDYDRLIEVRTKNARTLEDANRMNAEGVDGNDKMVDSLDAVQDALGRLADAQDRVAKGGESEFAKQLAKLAPSAQEFVKAIIDGKAAWRSLATDMQQVTFVGQAERLTSFFNKTISSLRTPLLGVAQELNNSFTSIFDSLSSEVNQGALSGIVSDTRNTLAQLRQGIDPLVEGILRLSDQAGDHLPFVANLLSNMLDRFNEWTKRVSESGQLDNWINTSIDAIRAVGDIAGNVVDSIGNIAAAWRAAGGDSLGFIGTLRDLTGEFAAWSGSLKGQNALTGYFREAREFLSEIWSSVKQMAPTFAEVKESMREWSVALFAVLGFATKLTNWVSEHSVMVKTLVMLYLTFKTLGPVWDFVAGSAKWYTKAVNAASEATGRFTNVQSKNWLKSFGDAWGQLTGKVTQVHTPLANANQLVARTIQNNTSALQPVNNLTSAFKNQITATSDLGQAMNATSVAANGSVKTSLMSGLRGLAGFIGPGLAFTVAVSAATWAIDELGEAHRNATRDADNQKAALDRLKNTLDGTTGAFTAETAKQTAKEAQQFPVPGFGNRNALEASERAGVPADLLVQATNPTQQGLRNDLTQKLDAQTRSRIESSDAWQSSKDKWAKYGVSLDDMVAAARGDEAAQKKIDSAEEQVFGKPRRDFNWLDRLNTAGTAKQKLPSLYDISESAGLPDSLVASMFLNNSANANVQQGTSNQQASAASGGRVQLSPAGVQAFGNIPVYMDNGVGVVDVNPGLIGDPQKWIKGIEDSGNGTATLLPDGRVHVVMSPDATKRNVEGFAGGGPIGGVGSGTSDSNLIAASRGEFMMRKSAVDKYGVRFMQGLNSGALPGFSGGGWLGPQVPPPAPKPAGGFFTSVLGGPVAGTGSITVPSTFSAGTTEDFYLKPSALHNAPSVQGSIPGPGATDFSSVFPSPSIGDLGVGQGAGLGSPFKVGQNPVSPPLTPAKAPPVDYKALYPRKWDIPSGPSTAPEAPAVAPGGNTPTPTSAPPVQHHSGGGGGIPSAPGPSFAPPALTSAAAPFPMDGGVPLTSRIGREEGLQRNTIRVKRLIENMFPQITDIGGYREDALKWHPNGLAIDVMIPGWDTPEGKALGDQINQWVTANKDALGVDYTMWQEKDHYNHIHVNTTGGGYPELGEQFAAPFMPGMPIGAIAPGLDPSAGYFPLPSELSSILGGGGGGSNLPKHLQPKAIEEFLSGQASHIGQSLSNIGVSFLQGATGLDLGPLLGMGKEIGNAAIGGQESGSTEDTSLTGQAGADIGAYGQGLTPGSMGADPQEFLNSLFGGASKQNATTEAWSPTVKQVLWKLAQDGQIDRKDINAWYAAVMRQMDFESDGNPQAQNNSDSNAAKGTPSKGLMQVIDPTFDSFVPQGFAKSIWDPASNIAAAVMYAKSKGGPSYMTGVHGYASGGQIQGSLGRDNLLIRASRGEFMMSRPAVDKYGVGFMHSVNAGKLPGFETGGPPLPPPPNQLAPPPKPEPAPGPAPGPAPAPGGPPMLGTPPTPGGTSEPGAPAPAPDPGSLPNPGADPTIEGEAGKMLEGLDPRATLGAAPTNSDHNNPALAAGIEGGINHVGGLVAQAASMAISAGAGAASGGAAMAGSGAGAAGAASLIQGGFQIGAGAATAGLNILSSLGVGSLTGGTTQSASGVPMLPERDPYTFGELPSQEKMQQQAQPATPGGGTGGPAIVNNYFGGIHTSNLDDWSRNQDRREAQQAMPFLSRA